MCKLIKTSIFILSLCLFFSGCTKEDEEPKETIRTVLYYIGGDNNLSGEALQKADQLKDVVIPKCGNLLIYLDSKNSNPKLMKVGNGKQTIVREYEDSNSANADVFKGVLQDVIELYPAPSYGLAVFSHGSGWMPNGTYGNAALRSVIIDGGNEMEIPDFAAAIPNGMFDHIIFEACFMAGVEVAYELKDKTKYIVASSAEIVSPGFTHVYAKAIPFLFKEEADLTGFCRAIKSDYEQREEDVNSLTLSLISTREIDGILDALRGTNVTPDISSQSFSRYGNSLFFDLCDGYKTLPADKQAMLQAATEACVIWKSATDHFMLPKHGGFSIQAHSGLTIYIPQDRYPNLNRSYSLLEWNKKIN